MHSYYGPCVPFFRQRSEVWLVLFLFWPPATRQFFPTSTEVLTMKSRFFQIVFNNNYHPYNLYFPLQSWNCHKTVMLNEKKKCRRLPPQVVRNWQVMAASICWCTHHATGPGTIVPKNLLFCSASACMTSTKNIKSFDWLAQGGYWGRCIVRDCSLVQS